MVNLNGTLQSTQEGKVSINNRGLQYGDAVFETLKVVSNRINFWEDHYFRLMASMRILRMEIPMTFSMEFLENEILKYDKKQENWELIKEYHFGGYGKYTDEFIHFINRFKSETDIPLDPIYTGKMMFGIVDMIKKNRFLNGSKILIIHSGGLQGIEGFNQRLISKQSGLKIL